MGIPKTIKSDNGCRFVSKAFQQWNIEHKTGIPYNPQRQGIVEYDHGSLKIQLQKTNKKSYTPSHHIKH